MPLPPAATLQQRYRIVRTIGSGGMGTVYLAEDTRLGGRLCAVKEHRPDPTLDLVDLAKLRRQFEQREVRILAELDHPNLPKVFDYFTEDGNDYLVMEYVAGDNLHIELSRHVQDHGEPLPEKVVLIWSDQVLDALHYLHTLPSGAIIHRDLKPANIILTTGGRIKVVDFGLAKLLTPTPGSVSQSMQLGTLDYAPPEQFSAALGPTDERSDIFSFGATLYHLLTGTPPPAALDRAMGAAAMTPARERNGAISERTEAALARACMLKKGERVGSVIELRELLGDRRVPGGLIQLAQTHGNGTDLGQTRSLDVEVLDTPVPSPARVQGLPPQPEPEALPEWLGTEDWCEVPAGPFLMGSTDDDRDAEARERPQHLVDLPRFWVGRYPVTYRQYRSFLDANDGYHSPHWWHNPTKLETVLRPGQQRWPADNRPAENVSWYDAMAYCRWLSNRLGHEVRLPTEAEWEKAARGTEGRRFAWGDKFEPGRANVGPGWPVFGPDYLGRTSDVGSYEQDNPYGVHDTCGNVWEWTTSLWGSDWSRPDWRYPYKRNDLRRENFSAPTDCRRVVRGGSWGDDHNLARAAYRCRRHPSNRRSDVGFRLVVQPNI